VRSALRMASWLCIPLLAALAVPARAQSPAATPPSPATSQSPPAAAALRLADLEQLALAHNPSLAAADATLRAVRGRASQAGLYPNPVIGYTGDEISGGPIARGGEHGFFFEQEIVTAGKRGLSRSVYTQEAAEREADSAAQKLRVLTAVRGLFYQALGAQRMVELRVTLASITRQATDVSKQLANVGQADQPDVLEAEVEAQRADLAELSAENDRERIWRQLSAAVGVPSLPVTPLAGSLDDPPPKFEFAGTLEDVLRGSPEVKSAESAAGRAGQAAKRARAEKFPDILVRGGVRDNRWLLETGGRPVGHVGFAEVGVRIPIFDRNQGNVQAAQAEIEHANSEIEQTKLVLRSRLARAFRNYSDAVTLAERYRTQMIPRAQKAYDLYLASYRQMAAAYPQVLIAQRNLAQLEVEYVAAQENLWIAVAEMQGMLVEGGTASNAGTQP
jgi:cobalt-zinc-cadmium efflux system outer membrane protein